MTYRRARGVAAVTEADTVYLATLPAGPIRVLTGTAALIWEAAVGNDTEGTVREVAQAAGVPPREVRPDVEPFLAELVALGLLEPVPAEISEISEIRE